MEKCYGTATAIRKAKKCAHQRIQKQRLKKLQELFDRIDEGYGYGPDEWPEDENKVDQYIEAFITKFSEYPDIIESFNLVHEDFGKSIMECLDEI